MAVMMFEWRDSRKRPARSGVANIVRLAWLRKLAVVAGILLPSSGMAQSPLTEVPMTFSIPAQPLGAALDQFGDVTGYQSFYDTNLVRGRKSGNVQGIFAPREALDRLLAATDLSVRRLNDGSFVLLAAPSRPEYAVPQTAVHRQYYALIQSSMRDAFCRGGTKWAGHHRFVAVFWIEPNGVVRDVQRLGPTLGIDADQQVNTALHNIRLGAPPPAGFEQPVLVLVVPKADGVTLHCDEQRAHSIARGGVQ